MKRPRSFIASFAFLIALSLVAPAIPNGQWLGSDEAYAFGTRVVPSPDDPTKEGDPDAPDPGPLPIPEERPIGLGNGSNGASHASSSLHLRESAIRRAFSLALRLMFGWNAAGPSESR